MVFSLWQITIPHYSELLLCYSVILPNQSVSRRFFKKTYFLLITTTSLKNVETKKKVAYVLLQQLRNELSNFQVGVNEVEGDRVLVKQSSSDKRVTSLGFPRIVDGSVIAWYKSRTHGDNFLVLRIFGGKLFVVEYVTF